MIILFGINFHGSSLLEAEKSRRWSSVGSGSYIGLSNRECSGQVFDCVMFLVERHTYCVFRGITRNSSWPPSLWCISTHPVSPSASYSVCQAEREAWCGQPETPDDIRRPELHLHQRALLEAEKAEAKMQHYCPCVKSIVNYILLSGKARAG
jgi:hypothetical protein